MSSPAGGSGLGWVLRTWRASTTMPGLRGDPSQGRVQVVETILLELRRRLTDPNHRPRPVQQPVPVMVGAMSERGLSETAERVAAVRDLAAGRTFRSDVLLQAIALGAPPDQTVATLAATMTTTTPDQLLDSPFVLLAHDAREAADKLLERREYYGFDSFTSHQRHLEALGEVIAPFAHDLSATSAGTPSRRRATCPKSVRLRARLGRTRPSPSEKRSMAEGGAHSRQDVGRLGSGYTDSHALARCTGRLSPAGRRRRLPGARRARPRKRCRCARDSR
jgi:hypothetical protein